ncbi:hypothetical protein K1X12_02145 [Hyphomonas sp. WL0036]|uniref:hypothetical protein n=1 Tax=Hyphomonas sediminis TaxID=2866160 RepID=UPI001C8205DD|nr:hypothetical protein [Hyphomonas sediminis]MBY9065680.1 hypothetical protein [Hyphomonas sediminis]
MIGKATASLIAVTMAYSAMVTAYPEEQKISPEETAQLHCLADYVAMRISATYALFSEPHTDERIKQDLAVMVLNYEFELAAEHLDGFPQQFSVFKTRFEEALKITNRLPTGGVAELAQFTKHAKTCEKWKRPESK